MSHHVTFQISFLRTSVRTDGTSIRLLSSVSVNMLLHSLFLRGTIITIRTRIRLFSCVSENMPLQVFFGGCTIGTVRAGKGLLPGVSVHVSQEVRVISGGVGAVVTEVGLDGGREALPTPCVPTRTLPCHTVTVQPHLLVMSSLQNLT